jgi:hypothetical protein
MRSLFTLALVELGVLLSPQISAKTASDVFEQVSPSVVVVVTYVASGKPIEQGSGVALPGGNVATNCHVLKDGLLYRVRYLGKDYPAQAKRRDLERDVCELSVPGLNAPPVTFGDSETARIGATVFAVGAPEGLELTLSGGIVSGFRNVDGRRYIQTTAAISPGSSGGGLFDEQGRLLGLTTFYMTKGQQLNFALPVEWITSLPQAGSDVFRRTVYTCVGADGSVNFTNMEAGPAPRNCKPLFHYLALNTTRPGLHGWKPFYLDRKVALLLKDSPTIKSGTDAENWIMHSYPEAKLAPESHHPFSRLIAKVKADCATRVLARSKVSYVNLTYGEWSPVEPGTNEIHTVLPNTTDDLVLAELCKNDPIKLPKGAKQ